MMSLVVTCLLLANHKDNDFMWNGKMMKVKRGSFITSYEKLSKQTGVSIQRIRSRLKTLQETSFLTYKTTNKYTVISINKYDMYQGIDKPNKPNDKQITIKKQTDNNKQECIKNEGEGGTPPQVPSNPIDTEKWPYMELVNILHGNILELDPGMKFKANWFEDEHEEIRKLIEKRGSTYETVEHVLIWLRTAPKNPKTEFTWRGKIKSGKKLREKFGDLAPASRLDNPGGEKDEKAPKFE